MADPFIGEIRFFGFNYAPVGWALCNGQTMQISQNQTLFALLGTIYGGNGTQTFALPNLQGRVPMHFGTGPGLTTRRQGEYGGHETIPLNTSQMPAHNHSVVLHGETALGNSRDPQGNMLALPSDTNMNIFAAPVPAENRPMASDSITEETVGQGQAHPNMQPYLVLNACIALTGIWPSRS